MKLLRMSVIILPLMVISAWAAAQSSLGRWGGCCGTTRWAQGPATPEPEYGSVPRHQVAMLGGVPEPYKSMSNPLAVSKKTVRRGEAVFDQHCVSCHGQTGRGDGAESHSLSPRPGDLAWLSTMPMANWDPFMYWTIAEGGAQFRTGMPAYKDKLSSDDIWAVISYIQARLPQSEKPN